MDKQPPIDPRREKAEALWTKAFAAWSEPENKPGDARRKAIEVIMEGLGG